RGARRAHPRRDAAAARGRVARHPQDRRLRDPQRRRSRLSRRPRGGDDAASRDGEDRGADPLDAPARPAQPRVHRPPERAAAPSRRTGGPRGRPSVMTFNRSITRRRLMAAGAGAMAAGLAPRAAAALTTVRQGYQTNLWGMPTYYLLRSGLLEKHGIAVEEFAVPSGNLTMQQMVARQVDLGPYAGPSFVLGNARGGLVAIAVIEHVGRSVRIMARKDLGLTKVEQLKGLKVANQTGSSVGDIFVGTIAPAAGLKKGDYQE